MKNGLFTHFILIFVLIFIMICVYSLILVLALNFEGKKNFAWRKKFPSHFVKGKNFTHVKDEYNHDMCSVELDTSSQNSHKSFASV